MNRFSIFVENLNEYAGLLALLALLASVFIPLFIFWSQRRDEHQEMIDELNAIEDSKCFPLTEEERMNVTRESYLRLRLKK